MVYCVATSLMSQVVIFSKVAACTSRPMAFNGHPRTCGHLANRSQKQASEKADQSTCGSGVLVIIHFIDGAIDWL